MKSILKVIGCVIFLGIATSIQCMIYPPDSMPDGIIYFFTGEIIVCTIVVLSDSGIRNFLSRGW